MDNTPKVITTLEDLLVNEFRACQSILSLTRDERQVLTRNEFATLPAVVEQKEALLDELSQIEDQRRMVAHELAQKLGIVSTSPTIAEIATALPPEDGRRINRLREGIVALSGEIHELTSGNRALAVSALERVDAVQTFLMDLCKPSLFYQPPGAPSYKEAEAAMGIDHRM
jgi:flagellar biosynthesis/type III secretory pathway chaperone